MKIWSSEHVFNHPWENVVKAALQKYPNPYNPSVIGIDVIDRTLENGVLKSHRLMASQWHLPSWIAKILGGNRVCYASEHSQVNLEKKEFMLRSRNLTFNNIIHVDEKLTYSIHPQDETKTLLKQEALITVKNAPLIDYLENMMATKINSNAQIGRQAIEFIIQKMNNITDVASNVAQFSK
ncbi:unnamed protein product [Brachionus calyciflorus]|uniref:PRELI/MSF1 domain-containing protein n=1 Tax=Brachionus calyciflorus TaxID=104777 RepID=A0A814F1R5_9BILA|nr:unnamed protein product [Brachionus calyciflorus]